MLHLMAGHEQTQLNGFCHLHYIDLFSASEGSSYFERTYFHYS